VPLFDSHCHLTDERFLDELDEVLERAARAGVSRMVSIASDPDDAAHAARIAADRPQVWCTAGLHPHAAAQDSAATRERIAQLAENPRVVAIGETGLDYHYDNAPREVQRASFEAQLHLAEARNLPVIVHAREADEDVIAIIRNAGARVVGVLHCFASGHALLDAGLDAGWFVSFSGLVSFRNYDGADLLRAVPADRLLIETDSPYLAPVPLRGKRNEPANVAFVADAVARIRGVSAEEIGTVTFENASRLYGLPPEDAERAGDR
jgi:TatD DNase family protein